MKLSNFPHCCGAYVIDGFGSPKEKATGEKVEFSEDSRFYRRVQNGLQRTNEEEFDRIMKEISRWTPLFNETRKVGKIILAVLAEYQLKRYDGFWAKKLAEAGFKPVSSWYNSSGGLCVLFQLNTNESQRELSELIKLGVKL